jgi:glycogen(starch) synthase
MKKVDFVFEVSYEVCNKVGGIYAVLKTKAPYVVEEYGDGYYAIGFYNQKRAGIEFDERERPEEFRKAFESLKSVGIDCYFGVWIIPGRPKTILVDPRRFMGEANKIKTDLWEWDRVDSLHADNTFTEPVVWSYAVGKLLEELVKVKPFKGSRCVAHFHEWLAGAGMLYLKQNDVKIATVFTTHATMLGRSLAGSGVDIYGMLREKIGSDEVLDYARRYGVIDKHSMEVACATKADILTTVSSVTADEVAFLWKRKPDVLLLNGIDSEKYASFEELTVRRRENRIQTRDFLTAYFMRYYPMDLMNIRSFFISGRHEFRNKGLDVFIATLGRLNAMLKAAKSEKNVMVFIFVPADIRGENIEVLKNKSLYEEIKDHVQEALPDIGDNILKKIITGGDCRECGDIIPDEFKQKCKKLSAHFLETRGENPPLCAFELTVPEDENEIIRALKSNGLLNRVEDKVKVIYYPAYLSSADRLISLDYNDATLTCDVGVFPSYYEPWGYTPVETAAQGTLAVTTNQAGFGRFINSKGGGIYVLKRMNRSWDDIVKDLAEKLYEITKLSKDELAHRRMNAKELSELTDWREFIKNYFLAYELAVKKAY